MTSVAVGLINKNTNKNIICILWFVDGSNEENRCFVNWRLIRRAFCRWEEERQWPIIVGVFHLPICPRDKSIYNIFNLSFFSILIVLFLKKILFK